MRKLAAIFMAFFTIVLPAQQPATNRPAAPKILGFYVKGRVPPTNSTNAEIDRYLRAQIGQAMAKVSLRPISENQADYLIELTTEVVENRVLFRLELIDPKDGAKLFSVNRVIFPGLLAETFMNDAVEQLAESVASNQDRFTLEGAVEYALIFLSQDEGAEIWMGTGAGRRSLGTIQDGKLEAAYFPFEVNSAVTVKAEKEGRWSREISVLLTPEPMTVDIPSLNVWSYHSLGVGISPTRQGGRATYRYNLFPDRVFFGSDVSLWLQYPFKGGAVPIYHDEIRAHAGAYLFFPEDYVFRFAAGIGVSTLQTFLAYQSGWKIFNDFTVDPFWFSLEWNLSSFAIFLETRFPYVLDAGGLLSPGFATENGPPWITLGGYLKW